MTPLQGADLDSLHRSSSSRGPSTQKPPIKLFRIKQLAKEEKIFNEEILVGEKEQQQVCLDGVMELFAGLQYGKTSEFEKKVQGVKKVFRVTNGDRSPNMDGRILGSSTNKYINFVADTGSPTGFIPRSVAIRNKLKIFPVDEDGDSYAGASGTKLTVIGQCQMFINFKQHKTIKELRALVIAEEGGEVLVGLADLVNSRLRPEPDYPAGAGTGTGIPVPVSRNRIWIIEIRFRLKEPE